MTSNGFGSKLVRAGKRVRLGSLPPVHHPLSEYLRDLGRRAGYFSEGLRPALLVILTEDGQLPGKDEVRKSPALLESLGDRLFDLGAFQIKGKPAQKH